MSRFNPHRPSSDPSDCMESADVLLRGEPEEEEDDDDDNRKDSDNDDDDDDDENDDNDSGYSE